MMQPAIRAAVGLWAMMFWTGAALAQAATVERIVPLYDALGMPELMVIMREEGLDYGDTLAGDLFPAPPGASWQTRVADIYALPDLEQVVQTALAEALDGADVDAMLAFFEAPIGVRIIELEIAARQALLDPDIEAAARETWDARKGEDTPRLAMLRDFVEENALIENNVVGALNSNFAFYQGLASGNAFGRGLSEDEMLADIWGQEDAVREETETWMYSYLMLAYAPLPDDSIEAYLEFSRTEAGRALNQAIFVAFDVMFSQVSRDLGAAAAQMMVSQEL